MTEAMLKKPKNHKGLIGKPMLYAVMPKVKMIIGGDATIQYNILTGHWMVDGQKGSPIAYIMPTLKKAMLLAKTVNHYNKTGEKKTFSKGNLKDLEII